MKDIRRFINYVYIYKGGKHAQKGREETQKNIVELTDVLLKIETKENILAQVKIEIENVTTAQWSYRLGITVGIGLAVISRFAEYVHHIEPLTGGLFVGGTMLASIFSGGLHQLAHKKYVYQGLEDYIGSKINIYKSHENASR